MKNDTHSGDKVALMRCLGSAAGFDVDQLNLLRSLEIPAENWAAVDGLNKWEHRLSLSSEALLLARYSGCAEFERRAAMEIGKIIVSRIAQRKDEVLALAYEGIKNLQSNQPYKLAIKRRDTAERIRVLLAFFFLHKERSRPTQTSIVRLLERASTPLKAGRIAKLFDELKLRELQGDERCKAAPNPAEPRSPEVLLRLAANAPPPVGYSEWKRYEPLVQALDHCGYLKAQAILWMVE